MNNILMGGQSSDHLFTKVKIYILNHESLKLMRWICSRTDYCCLIISILLATLSASLYLLKNKDPKFKLGNKWSDHDHLKVLIFTQNQQLHLIIIFHFDNSLYFIYRLF